ncbi:MAG: Smr/MutS family protein [Treponema sp.]|nr:Smr/MutS family protein [Treponema sp.]
MDFGDILDAWDRQTARTAKKKRSAGTAPAADPLVFKKEEDPLTVWLRLNDVVDKDASSGCSVSGAEEEERPGDRRRRLLNKKPDGILDLHGLTRDEAWNALDVFFEDSRRQGFEKIFLVHGKGIHSDGEAVLKRIVREYIERCPFAGESGTASHNYGGSGVTWVLLKSTKR